MSSDERDTLADLIHEAECVAYNHEGRNARCEREARAILESDWLAAHDRAVEQRALRDAVAALMAGPPFAGYSWTHDAIPWLRDRAEALGEDVPC